VISPLRRIWFLLLFLTLSASSFAGSRPEDLPTPPESVLLARLQKLVLLPRNSKDDQAIQEAAKKQGLLIIGRDCGQFVATFAVDKVLLGKPEGAAITLTMPMGEFCAPDFEMDAGAPLLLLINRKGRGEDDFSWVPLHEGLGGALYIIDERNPEFLGVDMAPLTEPFVADQKYSSDYLGTTDDYTEEDLASMARARPRIACVQATIVSACGGVPLQRWVDAYAKLLARKSEQAAN